ncbi:nucleoside hydrolase [Streptomyces sp. NPDC007164]|uniref:nucleoside hydrolase n=1 Tax=Streptomyces sp. NPDC007164 TaxID=3156918 RepID=UPI0033D91F9D
MSPPRPEPRRRNAEEEGRSVHQGHGLVLVRVLVTLQVRLTRQHAAEMLSGGGRFGRYAGEMTLAWIDATAERYPGDPEAARSCAMHDPLAAAAVSRPDLITWAPAHVDVITSDEVGRGVAVADLLTSEGAPAANAQIATAVDVDAFLDYLLDRIRSI